MPESRLFEIEVGGVGLLTFGSAHEILGFFQVERAAYGFLSPKRDVPGGLPEYIPDLRNRQNTFCVEGEQITKNFGEHQNVERLQRELTDLFARSLVGRRGGVLLSKSPAFARIREVHDRYLAEGDEWRAYFAGNAAWYATVGQGSQGIVNIGAMRRGDEIAGLIDVELGRLGVSERTPIAARQSMEALLVDGRTALEARHHDINKALDEVRAFETKARIDNDARTQEYNTRVADALARLEHTHAHYTTVMQLKAPVEYWTEKAVEHARKSKVYRWWVVGGFLLGLIALALAYVSALAYVLSDAIPKEAHVAAVVYVGGLVAVFTTAILWALRLFVRMYMSHQHLTIDSEERAAMLKTFLALSEQSKVTDADRALVLAPIFRPTSDGIVKDDAAPITSLPALVSGALDRR